MLQFAMMFLAAAAVAPATSPAPTTSPAPFVVVDAVEFARVIPADARVEKLAGGFKFVEGPVWTDAGGGGLIFSDIPANHLKRWTAKDGVAVFRDDSHQTNGNTLDGQGRLISCEHAARRVTRTGVDGKVEVVADSFGGKRLNSPNDVVVAADGAIYFTDPPYGLGRAKSEQGGNFVYRIDPKEGKLSRVVEDMDAPNGLCFSPDQKVLYVADSGRPHLVRAYDVKADGTLGNGRDFCTIDKGVPDGMRCDEDGRLWSSAGDGVQIFSAQGKLIGKVLVGEAPANLCFGGEDGRTLFITARTSLYAIGTKARGAGVAKPK